MRNKAGIFGLAALALSAPTVAADRYTGPVIDVHLHAASADTNGPAPTSICPAPATDLRYDPQTPWPQIMGEMTKKPPCKSPFVGPGTDEEVMEQTIAAMRQHKVRGFLSSDAASFARWSAKGPGLFIASRDTGVTGKDADMAALAKAFHAGEFAVLGEIGVQYAGVMADDPSLEPLWKLAEDNDIPVGIHLGMGPPGSPALTGAYRLQSPLRLQEVLARHPRLRLYAMHGGYPLIDDLKAMLYAFPQLHLDTGVLQLALPRKEYHAFLAELVRSGYGDRIMFGSDQMNWPGLIAEGIAAINDAPSLTAAQKQAILHDNAVRFFRLDSK